MTFKAGDQLGPYEIIGTIGGGGMGSVYKARDSRLDRTVAIKVVSDNRAGQEFQQRLRKEAKAASALSHQNIIAIYDILGLEDGEAIVMEYVPGQSLREVLQKKSISTEEAIEVIAQAATALAVAHNSGIVHRDIKPENIILTTSNQAKVLDFGIAKVLQTPHIDSENLPTQTIEQQTQTGIVLGTPFYMSPEQAQGRSVDWRTDIFALGVVLYEALAEKRPFNGNSTVEVMHAVINENPSPLKNTSPALQDILEKALAKLPDERYQSAADFALDLRRLKKQKPSLRVQQMPSRKGWAILATLLALALLSFVGYSILQGRQAPTARQVKLTPITTDEGYEGEASFFPDGETIAYVSDRTGNFDIFLRQVSGGPDLNITNDPADDVQPSVSPDGRWIAFVSTRESQQGLIYTNPTSSLTGGDIWIMPALGGAPRKIAANGNFPAWSPDGKNILYTAGHWMNQHIFRVSSSGGTPDKIPIDFSKLRKAPLFLHRPTYSPNGKWITFEGNADEVLLVPADGGTARNVSAGRSPTWNKDGSSIIFSSAETGRNYALQQISFDSKDGSLGSAAPLTASRGADFQPAVSRVNGNIAFSATDVTFNIERVPFGENLDPSKEQAQQLTFGNNINWYFDTSPDGKEVVYESLRGSTYHIWKVTADGRTVQLTSDPQFNDRQPSWSPDGHFIAFVRSNQNLDEETRSICIMSKDGANPSPILTPGNAFLSWMPDNNEIIFFNKGKLDAVHIQKKTSRTIIAEKGVRNVFNMSADGRWLVYGSMKEGTTDLRAMPVQGGNSIAAVTSLHEDGHPFFSVDSKWLYYQRDHKNLFRVPGPAQNWRPDPPVQVTFFPESGLYLEAIQRTRDGKFLLYSRGRIRSDIWFLSQ